MIDPNPESPSQDPDAPGVAGVSRHFDDRSTDWEHAYGDETGYPRRYFLSRMEGVLGLLGDLSGQEVLDVGCASGTYLEALAARGARVTGADLSPRMIRRAGARAREEGWSRLRGLAAADCRALPFAPDSFDAVIAVGVLEYVPQPRRFLDEAGRLLRPGGRLLVTVPHVASPATRLELTLSWLARRTGARDEHDFFHERPSPARVRSLLAGAGYTVRADTYRNYLPYNLALRLPGSVTLDRALERVARLPGLAGLGASYLVIAERPA